MRPQLIPRQSLLAQQAFITYTERRELRSDCTTHCKIHNMCKTHVLAVFAKHLFLALTCTFTFPSCLIDPTAVLQTVGIARAICRQRVSPPLHLPGISSSRHCWIGQKMSSATLCLFPQKGCLFWRNSYQVVSGIAKRPLWQYPVGMRQNAHLLIFFLLEKNPI